MIQKFEGVRLAKLYAFVTLSLMVHQILATTLPVLESPATHNGAYYKIWTDEQCPNLGQGSKYSIEDCKSSCRVHPSLKCTAINWRSNPKECVLRDCPRPVPNPTWEYKNYRGYIVSHSPGSTIGYLTKGPFSLIWTRIKKWKPTGLQNCLPF